MSWIDDYNAQAARNAGNTAVTAGAPPTWNKWQIQQAQERQRNIQSKLRGQQPQQEKKRNSWLTLVPGALAAGASFVPGVGTAAAAAIGGAGELAAQRLNGEKTNWAKIGQEAALSAIPGGIGKVGKVAKILKTGTNGLKVANATAKVADVAGDVSNVAKVGAPVATNVATTAAPALSKIEQIRSRVSGAANTVKGNMAIGDNAAQGVTSKIGDKLRSSTRGIQAGDKVGGKVAIDSDRAKEINAAINTATKGVTGKTVRGQVVAVQNAKNAAAKELDDAVANAGSVTMNPATRGVVAKDITKGREAILDFSPSNAAHVAKNNEYLARLQAAKTPKEILEARRAFDDGANAVFKNTDATASVNSQLAAVYRNAADKMLAEVSPAAKAASTKFSTLSQAEKALTSNASKVNPGGIKPFGTSLNGKGIGGGTMQAAQDTAGKVFQAAGANTVAAKGARSLVKQGLVRAVDTSTDYKEPDAIDPAAGLDEATKALLVANGDIPGDPNATATDPLTGANLGGGEDTTADDPNDQFSPSNVKATIAAMSANGSSTKEMKDYLDIAKTMQALTGSKGSTAKPLSAVAAKQQATANSGLDSLNTLQTMIDNGGVPKGTVVPGRGLVGGLGQSLLGTSGYDAAADNIADSIIRMRTGAAATKGEMQTFRAQLPQANDPPEVQRQKLATVRAYLLAISNGTGETSAAGDNTELMAAYGQ